MLFGKLGEKNFLGIMDGVSRFCSVESTKALGHRDAAALRVCCDAQDRQIHDIDVTIYLGDRLNSGCFASLSPVDEYMEQACIDMVGRRVGLNTKETVRSRHMLIKYTDFIGFSPDNNVLLVYDKNAAKLDFLIKLRLRDIYSLRLNNITERVANCLVYTNSVVSSKIDVKWLWTRKLICLAALECLLRVLGLWDNELVRNESRNEAVIKLMLGDLLFDGIDGLDEYNMYANDAEQRVKDSELLLTCGRWLASGGTDVAESLRASDLSERDLSVWKTLLETSLGVVLPPLTKHGEMRRTRPLKASAL